MLRPYMNAATDAEAADLINWARGEYVLGKRDRQGRVLGDIIHATPVVVGKPRNFFATEAFQQFSEYNENRRKQVYVGANDGMVHAFDAESGYEAWAFVPEFSLPLFTVMADSGYCHRYSCDQTVTAQDIVIDGQWRTVLATGGGRGGGAIFAMDVTDPDNPSVMWQQFLPNLAPIHSQVQITTIGDQPVALVGSGLEDETSAESWLWSYDLETGHLIGGLHLSTVNGRNKCSRPEMVDMNLDGNTDLLYVADMAGSVWRIAVGDHPDPAAWQVSELFECNREITADPVAAYGSNGEIYVYFGTGSYLEDSDLTTTDQHYFVCAFDKHTENVVGFGDMANQTSSLHIVDGDSGWYVELEEMPGERVTERAVVVAEEVIFTSYAPSEDPCAAGGQSWLYEMKYDNGGAAGEDDEEDDLDKRVTGLGEGVASFPVVDLASGTIVVQSSDASITINDVDTAYMRLTVRSWQETYDHVQEVVQGDPQP
jgi:type IV pilus assembly protein PilY1